MALDGKSILSYEFKEKITATNTSQIPLTEKQLETWLTSLPMLKVDEACDQLKRYLQQLNQLTLPSNKRLVLLERLRPTIAALIEVFVKTFRGRVADLTPKGHAIHQAVSNVNAEIAEGYKYLLFSLADQQPGFFSRKNYVLLTARVVFYLSEQLRLAYLIYADHKADLWQQLHRTYDYACQTQLEKITFKDDVAVESEHLVTIEKLYKRMLLQAMALSQGNLRSAQIDMIYQAVLPWADDIKITPVNKDDVGYFVDMASNRGPFVQREKLIEATSPKLFKVDNSLLLERLTSMLDSGDNAKQLISHNLLNYLIMMLTATPIRSEERLANNTRVHVVVGLNQIEKVLTDIHHIELEEQISELAVVDEDYLGHNWGIKESADLWGKLKFSTVDNPKAKKRKQAQSLNDHKDVTVYDWIVVNASFRGYGLKCHLKDEYAVNVGDLVVLSNSSQVQLDKPGNHSKWKLAVVCWMKASAEIGVMNIGVHQLASDVKKVHIEKHDHNIKIAENGLLLADENDTLKSMLIARNYANTGEKLKLIVGENSQQIMLDDVVWYSDGFAQYHFHIVS